ncbi:hypothetical protein STEG23_008272 [Scotinomys teguina]
MPEHSINNKIVSFIYREAAPINMPDRKCTWDKKEEEIGKKRQRGVTSQTQRKQHVGDTGDMKKEKKNMNEEAAQTLQEHIAFEET